ncbi:MAG TPA: histidine kinase dimerization/phosphoacceptor domain-containing protein [Ktedonobacteraceae bacterium]
MQAMFHIAHIWLRALSRIWEKRADASDFVWLARFRLLTIYSIIRSGLLLAAGAIGIRLQTSISSSPFHSTLLFWLSITFAISAGILLLILGLKLASKLFLSGSIGMTILFITDIFLLLAVMYACISNNLLLLLVIVAFVTCATPLFVERISRFAKRFKHSRSQLMQAQQERDALILQYTQELSKAIEQERLSLRREIHDGLMQELSGSLLQVSIIIMRNSVDDALLLDAPEVARLEAALRHSLTEARRVMENLSASQPVHGK